MKVIQMQSVRAGEGGGSAGGREGEGREGEGREEGGRGRVEGWIV